MAMDGRTTAPYIVPPTQQFDGNDGAWSTFRINVGTPGQDFRVLPSTQSGETYIVVAEGCTSEDGAICSKSRGAEIYDSAQNAGFELNRSSTWSTIGQYDVHLEENLNYTAAATFGYDRVGFGSAADNASLSLSHQVVGGVAELAYWMGYLPLGTVDSKFSSLSQSVESFLTQLRSSAKIPSLSFAYTAGAKYRLKSVMGDLILGGYDSTKFISSAKPVSFTFSDDPSRLLTVGVSSITATNTLVGSTSLSARAHFSLVDSSISHLWLPRDICDNFEAAFGLEYDSYTDLYLVNDTTRLKLLSKNPSITINLVNSLQDTAQNYTDIVLPYAAFDLQASYPYYDNATNYFPIRRAANDSQYALGRTLLQEAYLIVDYERANFTILQAAFPDPLPAANIITIEPPTKAGAIHHSRMLSTGPIAGIVVAGVVVLVFLSIAPAMLSRKKMVGGSGKGQVLQASEHELANKEVSEISSEAILLNTTSDKAQLEPQELGNEAIAELPCLGHDLSTKSPRSGECQDMELYALRYPRWEEVNPQQYLELDASSTAAQASR